MIPLIRQYQPDHPMVVGGGADGEQVLTQRDFLHDLQRLIPRLPAGDSAFVLCQDRYHFLLVFCANLLRGTVNLLPPNGHDSTLQQIAADHPGCLCLTDTALDTTLPCTDIRQLLAAAAPVGDDNPNATDIELPDIPADRVAALAFTSGSTGTPNPNTKRWGTLAAATGLLSARLLAGQRATVLATVPSQHMYGLEMTVMMALQGLCTLHRGKPFYPEDIRHLLQTLPAPVLLVSTPVHLRAMVNAGLSMPPVAAIVSATAPLDSALAQAAADCFQAAMLEVYGCTETGSLATRETNRSPLWQPLEGIELHSDAEGSSARAPHLPETVPLQDQLELQPDGRFALLGRNADMINVAGKRASLADLTQKLLDIDGVHDGVIFMPDDERRQAVGRPAALVVSDLSRRELVAALATRMDAEFIPRPLRRVDALPRNDTGKLTRATITELWRQTSER